jgi:hypothetical protein
MSTSTIASPENGFLALLFWAACGTETIHFLIP